MATSSLSTESFKMPSEPYPLPSLGSDEESFVVLWKDMDSKSIVEINHEPIGTGIVEEAKQLINKELTEMEKLSLVNKAETQAENNLSVDGPSSQSESKVVESTQMDKSSVLPKMPQVEKGFETSDVISITTLSTDLTSEQVQKKVSEIVEENIRLKDTILQNNMSMKSQYERIVAWQEDVQKVHQAHKEKIIEAKEFIEKLKKENYNLIRELEQLKAVKNAQDEDIVSLTKAIREKEQRSAETNNPKSKENFELELDMVNKTIKQLEVGMKNLTVENEALKEEKVKVIEVNKKVEEYEKEIDGLQTILHASKRELEEAKMELMKMKSTDEEKMKSLNEVIDSLRSQLFFTKQQQTVLPTQEEVANIRQQLANTQVMLTQVEQTRSAPYIQLQTLNKENLELKTKLGEFQTQTDDIYALKAQLDVYKADFEAERNAKETIKNEKERLSEDMQNLQRRNQQLQEEIELLRENDYVVPPSVPRERMPTPSAPCASSGDHPMKCPVCNFGFKTHQALENHVYRCIELNDHLP
ncbi:NF-kappa-B essential modulator isoform X2 [Anoplophora glabripennis]|uniref:Optineurin n=1 Tax=Anoplophora glabripennis TaxID=217634 RepID=V5GU80_ANOGL|nr:NF-kappa-B essential modulator isoform X2 [Anoplophora glabripennis]